MAVILPFPTVRGHAPGPIDLARIAADLRSRGLRPIVDHELEYVLADCQDCHAQESDPAGMWRPLRVVPRGKTLTIICTACGVAAEVRNV